MQDQIVPHPHSALRLSIAAVQTDAIPSAGHSFPLTMHVNQHRQHH